MPKKYDIQLAVSATQAQGQKSAGMPQGLAQYHIAFAVSSVPAVGSLAIQGITQGASDWSLITTIDMTQGAQQIPFMGMFDRIRCVPTGFDAGKSYTVTVTTIDKGLYANGLDKSLTRSQIAAGITATKNVNINSHSLIPLHQLHVDCVGTPAGSVAVFGKPINGALVPLGSISLTSGPRHMLFRGLFDGLQFVPTGLAGAKLSFTLVSGEDGMMGPSLDMLMPSSTALLVDGSAYVYNAAANRFIQRKITRRGALYVKTAVQAVVTGTDTAMTFVLADQVYDTDGIWAAGNPTRFTVPKGCTAVELTGNIEWAAGVTGLRRIRPEKNGADFNGQFYCQEQAVTVVGNQTLQNGSCGPLDVVAGDFFELFTRHSQGANLNINANGASWFLMRLTDAT